MKKLVIALIVIMLTVSLHFGCSAVQNIKAVQSAKVAQLNF